MTRGRRGRKPPGNRAPRPRFLIVCEGEKTEPRYFRAFPVAADVHVVGTGKNTLGVVDEAHRQAMSHRRDDPYDDVWCVFDRDSFPAQDFDTAIQRVQSYDEDPKVPGSWGAAWSHEAFELWYLLHFAYLDAALDRNLYAGKLTDHLSHPYQKNDPRMYDFLEPHLHKALAHAHRLASRYGVGTPPSQCAPCTRVMDLVERLRHLG